MSFSCDKAVEPVYEKVVYFFTTKFPETAGTHLIDLGRMKG